MHVVSSKSEMFQLWTSGAFGNRLRVWGTYEEMVKSGYAGHFSMRYKGSGGGAWCAYDVQHQEMESVRHKWIKQGADPAKIYYCESAPDDKIIVQGEVRPLPDPSYFFPTSNPSGLYFYHSFEKMKMRDAFNASVHHIFGMRVLSLLKHHMTDASFEDFNELRERYPDSVIEVSIYKICLGDIPRRNAIVWEIRNY